MKSFVIKVKENCYWLGGFYGKNNYDDITHAKIYVNETQANKQCKLVNEIYGHNAKVVEITIVEGNFDAYIDTLQNERDFERRDKTLIVKQLNDFNDYVIREDYIKLEQENKILKKALELACEWMSRYRISCPPLKDYLSVECFQSKSDCYCRYFIQQAKESLKDEKPF